MTTSSELYDTAVAATTADEVKDLKDEKKAEQVARIFLAKTCPQFLEALDDSPSTADRLIKAGRNIAATLKYAQTSTDDNADDTTRTEKAVGALTLLVEECSTLANILSGKESRRVPTVRYGKTELQMPLVTLGCMRFQQSWNRDGAATISKIDQVEQECQDNLVQILKHGISMGVTHIETAKGYGCSELQLGCALEQLFKEKFVKREDLIIQTKGGLAATMTPASYKKQVLTQLQTLKLKYVDLYSVHGLNSEEEWNYLFDNPEKGNLITALQELQAEGKIGHIGFSTHGRTDLIRRAIETDAFAYINLHHHFVGSYTASGDSDATMTGGHHGNWANIELARSKDMGVFIISPYDKGGRLYAPSVKLRELTLPEFEPMAFGSLWLWQYHLHQKTPASSSGPMAHTMTIGAARPSDLDQPILASFKMIQDDSQASSELLANTNRVSERLQQRMESALPGGAKWAENWHVGLPNWYHAKFGTQHGNIVWLYNLIHAYGLLDFAKERYATLEPRTAKWDDSKPKDENVAQYGGVWHWVPGSGVSSDHDYTEDFANCPEENRQQLKEAVAFVHKWCRPVQKDEEGEKLNVPYEWETAYDMRPWTAFPER